MALVYLEEVDNISPNTASFTLESGRATSVYLLQNPEASDLAELPLLILGDLEYDAGDGRLQRTPPLCHPIWPELYASSIQSVVGLGDLDPETHVQAEKVDSTSTDNSLMIPPISEEFYLYPYYRVVIEFTSRPFPVVLDAEIGKTPSTWYDDSGDPVGYYYANEWDRYTDFERVSKFQAVTAQQGTMKFQSTNNCIASQIYPGMPKMPLPDATLKYVWYQIPYRLVLSPNSYFDQFLFRVNFNAWQGYPPGSLLYVGWNARKYTPPVQQIDPYNDGLLSQDKWCNMEFTFLHTKRTANDVPTSFTKGNPPVAYTPNPNFVLAGWNLMPWVIDRKYHLAFSEPYTASCTTVNPTPSFFSFPVELLFYDPDAADAYHPGL